MSLLLGLCGGRRGRGISMPSCETRAFLSSSVVGQYSCPQENKMAFLARLPIPPPCTVTSSEVGRKEIG